MPSNTVRANITVGLAVLLGVATWILGYRVNNDQMLSLLVVRLYIPEDDKAVPVDYEMVPDDGESVPVDSDAVPVDGEAVS